jgi:hypothetical protein
MTYFVHAPDGQKYGPADLQILQQWIHAGSVISTTIIEDPQTGMKFQASQIPGLVFMAQSYPRQSTDTGEKDLRASWWCFGLSFLPCLTVFFASFGLYLATNAKRKGHPGAHNAYIANVVMLVISFVGFLAIRIARRLM